MRAQVFRLYSQGQPVDRELLLTRRPPAGDLRLRLRVTGHGRDSHIYLATLERGKEYVIPCLDRARVVEIRGRWLLIEGVEINPRGSSYKRLASDNYPQRWWCRVEGAAAELASDRR